jgi:hypothetical protein
VAGRSAATEGATSARGKTQGDDGDHASDIDATQVRFESIARAICQGYSFGPATSCRSCHATLIDFDSKCCGFCERCWAAIEAHKAVSE